MEPAQLLKSIEKGVGNTLGGLALVICLGAVLGKILEAGGAINRIATTLIGAFGEKNIQWALLATGFLIGIPLYYNAGFVILVPLVFSVAHKARLPLLYIALPMAASLSATHCFLPPHPSPVFLVNAFKADMGKTLVYGLIVAAPVVMIAGPMLGRFFKKADVEVRSFLLSPGPGSAPGPGPGPENLPAAFPSFLVGLLPVLLNALGVVAEHFLHQQGLKKLFMFMGDPTIALLLSVFLAIACFGVGGGRTIGTSTKWLNEAIGGIAVILLIITAGGVFKQVLQDSGVDRYIASFSGRWRMPPLLFGWIVTALLRVSIGSATVAGITAAGVVGPLVASGSVSPELMVLAVGTGSVFGSHVNDSAFWMFKEFFQLTVRQTFLSWTVMETTISLLGLGGVLLLDRFV
jgi:Gnt-I system high-affinity gluconate transporter